MTITWRDSAVRFAVRALAIQLGTVPPAPDEVVNSRLSCSVVHEQGLDTPPQHQPATTCSRWRGLPVERGPFTKDRGAAVKRVVSVLVVLVALTTGCSFDDGSSEVSGPEESHNPVCQADVSHLV